MATELLDITTGKVQRSSLLYTLTHTCSVFTLNIHPNYYGVLAHCGFDLQFPSGSLVVEYCVCMSVSVEHL